MQIKINSDDYSVIQTIKNILDCDDTRAAAILFEIGLISFISYPTGIKKIDDILESPGFCEIVKVLKGIWHT